MLEYRGHEYPKQTFRVHSFPDDFGAFFPQPEGLITGEWPPVQLTYLGEYVRTLGCKTILIEEHYIDRDFIGDVALFYGRCLRNYPNHCQRLHFFSHTFDETQWRSYATCSDASARPKIAAELQSHYLGFIVIRPLPGSLVGRTVLPTFPAQSPDGARRMFSAVREYKAHVAGFELSVQGLAFQQQDRGVSACATTALWSSLHCIAQREGLTIPTPAEITEAASKYVIGGRSLPSEGLTLDQLCEATRAAGLSPLVIQSETLAHDRGHLFGYLASGFPPLLAIQPLNMSDGHAVCAVGLKLGDELPHEDPNANYRDGASTVRGAYIHDDRLGPYASADLSIHTQQDGRQRTSIKIRWPGSGVEFEQSLLTAIVVPLPAKIRLTIGRIRALAAGIADAAGAIFPQFARQVVMHCQYVRGAEYQRDAVGFSLTSDGLYQLLCGSVFSKYVGLIRINVPGGTLFDALMDATETEPNPSMICIVAREAVPSGGHETLQTMARQLGAAFIQ